MSRPNRHSPRAVSAGRPSFARWVHASGQERQQLKWFAYAAAIMIGGFLLAFTFGTSELMWDLGFLVGIVGFAFLPLATAIAVLKYRLYDIDRIINRTLVYGSLTVSLALVYFGGMTEPRPSCKRSPTRRNRRSSS